MEVAERTKDALEILREDHRRIKRLFDEFESANIRSKKIIGDEALQELQLCQKHKQQLFYPAVKKAVDDTSVVTESEAAQHVENVLIQELKKLPAGERYNAKFKVLIKMVQDHFQEDENRLFPEAERSRVDLERLGYKMQRVQYPEEFTGMLSSPINAVLVGVAAVAVLGTLIFGARSNNTSEYSNR